MGHPRRMGRKQVRHMLADCAKHSLDGQKQPSREMCGEGAGHCPAQSPAKGFTKSSCCMVDLQKRRESDGMRNWAFKNTRGGAGRARLPLSRPLGRGHPPAVSLGGRAVGQTDAGEAGKTFIADGAYFPARVLGQAQPSASRRDRLDTLGTGAKRLAGTRPPPFWGPGAGGRRRRPARLSAGNKSTFQKSVIVGSRGRKLHGDSEGDFIWGAVRAGRERTPHDFLRLNDTQGSSSRRHRPRPPRGDEFKRSGKGKSGRAICSGVKARIPPARDLLVGRAFAPARGHGPKPAPTAGVAGESGPPARCRMSGRINRTPVGDEGVGRRPIPPPAAQGQKKAFARLVEKKNR